MALTLSLLFSLLFIYTCNAFDITQILNQYPEFSTFNSYLTQTSLATEINSRQTITVLVIDNANAAALSSKPLDQIKNILAVHVILDYYDVPRLQQLSGGSSLVTTLFQSTGLARGQQGFLNVTRIGTGSIVIGSAMPGSPLSSNLVKSVVSQPYNFSVIQVSSPIIPQGIDGAKTSSPTATPGATQPPPSTVTPATSGGIPPPPSIVTPATPGAIPPPPSTVTPATPGAIPLPPSTVIPATSPPMPSSSYGAIPPPPSTVIPATSPPMPSATPGAIPPPPSTVIPATSPPISASSPPLASLVATPSMAPPNLISPSVPSLAPPPVQTTASPLPSTATPAASTTPVPTTAPTTAAGPAMAGTPSASPASTPMASTLGPAAGPGAETPITEEPAGTTPAEPKPKKGAGTMINAGLAGVCTVVLSTLYLASRI